MGVRNGLMSRIRRGFLHVSDSLARDWRMNSQRAARIGCARHAKFGKQRLDFSEDAERYVRAAESSSLLRE